MKCTRNHLTKDCSRKERDRDVLCVLCNGNHPANYKGCEVYKQLQKKKFPPLRRKTADVLQQPTSFVKHGVSYAEQLRQQSQQEQFINNVQPNNQPQLEPQNQQSNDMHELKLMMKDLMSQMGMMINLLTTLVSKMP